MVQKTKIDWWRADSHWSQCQLYFSRQFHFIFTFHERVFNMPSIWWCNFINLHICFFTNEFYFMPSIWSCNFYSHALFSNECFYRRQSELSNALSLIIILERVSLTPSIRIYSHYLHLQCPIWPHLQRLRARKGHLYFILSRYLEYLSPSRSRPRFMLVLMLIRSRCN